MSAVRVVSEQFGGGPLAAAAVAGRVPGEWYPARPATAAAWGERAALVRRQHAAPGWLAQLAPALGGGRGVARLERVAAAGGTVVTTGQQPGLFGGPIYTWSKALSALELADALEQATGVPTAPLFWAATDDADFAEASVTHVAVPGGVDTLRMPGPPTDGVPMARVPLGDLRPLFARLARGAGSAPYDGALRCVRDAYVDPMATAGSAYVALLRALLEPLGVAVLDASHPAVRRAGAGVTRHALSSAAAIADALDRRERALAAAGMRAQVAGVPGLTLVFVNAPDGTKRRVPLNSATSVAASAADDALSPNVLLRPVVERAIVPTVAYVAGPGELAYFAQVSAVAEALHVPTPLAVPRWSGTLVEPHVQRLLDRLGVDAAALRDPHAAEAQLARAAMPAGLRDALARGRAGVAEAIAHLRAVPGGDAVAGAVLDGADRALAARLDRLERRYAAAFKRREASVMRDVATARGALWPLGKRQERTLNFIPLLARHGPALIDGMRAAARDAMRALAGATSAGGDPGR